MSLLTNKLSRTLALANCDCNTTTFLFKELASGPKIHALVIGFALQKLATWFSHHGMRDELGENYGCWPHEQYPTCDLMTPGIDQCHLLSTEGAAAKE